MESDDLASLRIGVGPPGVSVRPSVHQRPLRGRRDDAEVLLFAVVLLFGFRLVCCQVVRGEVCVFEHNSTCLSFLFSLVGFWRETRRWAKCCSVLLSSPGKKIRDLDKGCV